VLTAGVDAQWQWDDRLNQSPDRTVTTRDQLERVSEIGPFLEARADLTARIILTLGGRYDRGVFRVDDRLLSDGDDSGERMMSGPSGSAGVTLDLGARLKPYAGVSTSFETPTTTELGNRPTGPGGFNPDLQPQKAVNYESGVRGRLAGVLGYSLSAYQADVRDELIPFEVPGDPGRRFYRNAGTARHRGLEASMALEPVSRVTLVAAYTLSAFRFREFRTATDTLDGNEIPGVPARLLYGSLRLRGLRGAWVSADVSAASGCYVDDLNTVRTSPWQTLGLRAGWEGRWGAYRLAPFLAVQNVFDERYIGSVSVNAQFGRYFEPAPGRNALLGVEIRPF
jgi:iron complex outermembrane receptor protein